MYSWYRELPAKIGRREVFNKYSIMVLSTEHSLWSMRPLLGWSSFADFLKVDIRSGTIVRVEEFQKARKPAYKLWIDFWSTWRQSLKRAIDSIVTPPEELMRRHVLAVVNFPRKQVADFVSEVLVLGLLTTGKTLCSSIPNAPFLTERDCSRILGLFRNY